MVVFKTLPSVGAAQERVLKITARATTSGNHRLRVELHMRILRPTSRKKTPHSSTPTRRRPPRRRTRLTLPRSPREFVMRHPPPRAVHADERRSDQCGVGRRHRSGGDAHSRACRSDRRRAERRSLRSRYAGRGAGSRQRSGDRLSGRAAAPHAFQRLAISRETQQAEATPPRPHKASRRSRFHNLSSTQAQLSRHATHRHHGQFRLRRRLPAATSA